MAIDIGGMRKPYPGKDETFDEDQLDSKEPFGQFHSWFQTAVNTEGIGEPNAMCLSTCTKDGRPSSRMVLCKGYGPDGFKFFTNYNSRKAAELKENPYAALNFYWEPLKRCVRVEGEVKKLSAEESTEYFMTRPIDSRIGAIVSPQSQVVPSRQFLLEKQSELKIVAQEQPNQISRPDHWGGYIVIPEAIEFWKGQSSRLHDRIRFRKPATGEIIDNTITHRGEDGWVYERLSP